MDLHYSPSYASDYSLGRFSTNRVRSHAYLVCADFVVDDRRRADDELCCAAQVFTAA